MADLKDWAIEYIKHKDVFTRTIVDIEENADSLIVKHKDREVHVLICPVLEADSFDNTEQVYCFNTKKNLDALINNWQRFVKYEKLTVFFVNPDSKTETKWIIKPYLHNKVADDDSLKNGLKSMFSTVDVRNS